MNWLIWKQHRKQFLILGILLVLYAAMAIPMGLHLWHIYQRAASTCSKTDTCSQLSSTLFRSGWDENLNPSPQGGGFNLIVLMGLALPFLLGIFIGVPLITREYNAGTNLLVWTRSISRRKWLTIKLIWILSIVALFAGSIVALTTFESKAGNALYLSRFSTVMFDMQGIVPVGVAVLAVSIGIALGAWFKRTMLAIGLTLVITLAAQIMIGSFVRPHYITPRTKTVWTNQLGGPASTLSQLPTGALVTSSEIVNNQGQVLNWANPPSKCIIPQSELPRPTDTSGDHVSVAAIPGGSIVSINGGPAVTGNCLEAQGYHYAIQYQPGYRY